MKAILADLDGVLVDSTASVEAVYGAWADRHGLDAVSVLAFMHGVPSVDVVRAFAPHLDAVRESRALDRAMAEAPGVVVLPGAVDLLTGGTPAAVVTSSSAELAASRFAKTELPEPAVLVTADDVARGKPDPEPYLLAARRLGVPIADCVVVEDAPAGIESGVAAGATVVAVTTSHPPEALTRAHRVIATLAEL